MAADGWDDVTAYGYDHVVDDPEMDWSRFCHGGRVLTSDPGRVADAHGGVGEARGSRVWSRRRRGGEFLRASSIDLSDAAECADADFEHLAFNEALFLPSHGNTSPGRHQADPELHVLREQQARVPFPSQGPKVRTAPSTRRSPCGSYHPNEPNRLDDVYAYYLKGTSGALNGWGDGVGRVKGGDAGGAGSKACAQSGSLRPGQGTDEARNSELASRLATNPNWSWGGVTPFVFEPGGALSTPWGPGEWGFDPAPDGPGKVIAKFVGTPHVLSFETAGEGAGASRKMR